jgi:hypothetical protein
VLYGSVLGQIANGTDDFQPFSHVTQERMAIHLPPPMRRLSFWLVRSMWAGAGASKQSMRRAQWWAVEVGSVVEVVLLLK